MSHQPLRILIWPKDANTLRHHSVKVEKESIPALQDFIDRLIATMYYGDGYGLSAIQVGNNLRIFVMDSGRGPEVFINPEITQYVGKAEIMNEGCLSFPGMFEDVERNNAIALKWLDREGLEHEGVRTGQEAQCIQHEMEHFEGKLISDRLSPLKRSRWASKLAK